MARFVLVHGGFSGAWIWLPLMDRLKAAGHSALGINKVTTVSHPQTKENI